jgi:hypothetical protein
LSFSPIMNCPSVDCPEPMPLNGMLPNHNTPKTQSALDSSYDVEISESDAATCRVSSSHEQVLDQSLSPQQRVSRQRCIHLSDLPVEIQESILDHLFGARASTTARHASSGSGYAVRGWSNTLRHPRRRQLSNLALVNRIWRQLIQERLYRHSQSPLLLIILY